MLAKANAAPTAIAVRTIRLLARDILTLKLMYLCILVFQSECASLRTGPNPRHLTLSKPEQSNHRAISAEPSGQSGSRYFTITVPFIASFSCGTQVYLYVPGTVKV